jgi:ubiquitin C-terminal hydrolase
LCALEPFRAYLLSDECERLLVEHLTPEQRKKYQEQQQQQQRDDASAAEKRLKFVSSTKKKKNNNNNNENDDEDNEDDFDEDDFDEDARRRGSNGGKKKNSANAANTNRARRGNNENNKASTSSSTRQQHQRYQHEEILTFPKGKTTMSSHGSGDRLDSNGGGGSGLGGNQGRKIASFNPRAPAMTRERRADVARGAARDGACLGKELRRVARTLRCGGYEAFPPTELLKAVWRFVPAFAGSSQQDAHEFARFALERLRKELLVGERMMKKREENERLKREYEESALLESDFDGDGKFGGRRRNGGDGFDDDKVLPGKVPKRARSFRPRKANASLTASPLGSKEGSPSCAMVTGSTMFAHKNVLAIGSGHDSDFLGGKGGGGVVGRLDSFLTGFDDGNNGTPTLGFLNKNNSSASPFQREADEQARRRQLQEQEQQQQQQQQQQLLHASSGSADTKEGLLTNNKHAGSPDTVDGVIDPDLKGFVIVSRWGAVEHKYGCSCRPCKAKRSKLEKENPSAAQAQNDRSTQTTQVVKAEDGANNIKRESNTPSVTNDPSPPETGNEKAPRVMSLHDVLNLKTPGKLTPVRTAAQKKRSAGGLPTAVQKLVAEAKTHMSSIESPKFDPSTPHTYFADAENMSDDPIWKIFGGVTISHVKCSECGQSNAMKEPFLDLSLPLPSVSRPMTRATSPPLVNVNALGLPNTGNNQNDVDDCTYWDHSAPIDGNGPNGEATIEQCLEAHTREETLGGDGGGNRYYCERCQAVTSATKRTSLNRDCPKVLVLHLKRFMWKGKSGQRAKIIAPVAFPLENLSLEPFLEPEAEEKDDDDVVVVEKPARGKGKSPVKKGSNKRKSSAAANEDKQQKEKDQTTNAGSSKSSTYDLSACVAHHGQAANAGHYTAVARDLAGDNRWRQFDDDHVRDIDDNEVKSIASQGYMFFYVRRDPENDDDDDEHNDEEQ